jgi:addiction module HigA family antidote
LYHHRRRSFLHLFRHRLGLLGRTPALSDQRIAVTQTGRFIPNRGGAAPRGLPRTRIERIAAETTGITADTALRLGKALGTSTQLWMNLQNRYDVEIAKREIGKKLDKIEPIIGHAAA